MVIREFAYPHSPAEYGANGSVPVPVKSTTKKRPVSICEATTKLSKVVAKRVSVDWYESEDRTLPSVSSF